MNCHNYKKTPYNHPWIPNRADPYCYKHTDGTYYFTGSVPEYDRIILRKADTLSALSHAPEAVIWRKHETGIMSCHIWAPELHYINEKWYLYFAAGDIEDIWAIRPYVLECSDKDPITGTWKELGMMQRTDKDEFSFQDFSLDMTVFEHHGTWYCIWAEKVSVGKKISNLYIAKLETPWKLATEQVLLTTPDYDWERIGFWVNEGPAVIKHDGNIYMTYSASATGACYCMGLMEIDETLNLLDPANWKKSPQPFLQTDQFLGLYGPGHNSFTISEDGTRDIMICHARPYDEIIGDPLYDPNRHAYLAEIQWKNDVMNLSFKNETCN